MTRFAVVTAIALALTATTAAAQAPAGDADAVITAARNASGYVERMHTMAADQMTDEDFAFRPTPDVRSFGELIGHVADSNFQFCAAAKGETAPVTGIEKKEKTRAGLQKALAESFAYCNAVYTELTPESARIPRQLHGRKMEVLPILIYRTHHLTLHYGNVITYMRLRGRIPPSSQNSPIG